MTFIEIATEGSRLLLLRVFLISEYANFIHATHDTHSQEVKVNNKQCKMLLIRIIIIIVIVIISRSDVCKGKELISHSSFII